LLENYLGPKNPQKLMEVPFQATPTSLVDAPASYHGSAGGFSFADGHSETKRWGSRYILVPPRPDQQRPYPYSIPGNDKALQADAAWLQDHTTRRK
jgi:prepilin-type processing-associated H-X9-DG protein